MPHIVHLRRFQTGLIKRVSLPIHLFKAGHLSVIAVTVTWIDRRAS
jgi:hypothetical protein